MELFIHQIVLFMLMLGMPYCIFHYAKDVFKPERKYNGKIHWTLLALNITITLAMIWSSVLYVAPAFAHYVMLITVRNPPPISFTSDVVFLSIATVYLIAFYWWRIRRPRKRRQTSRMET